MKNFNSIQILLNNTNGSMPILLNPVPDDLKPHKRDWENT